MEIPEAKNKMIPEGVQIKNKSEENGAATVVAVGASMNEYHFPGAPTYLPMSVRATNIEQATEIWKIKRIPVKPEKVEEPKENINE